MSYSFPILSNQEILACLSELDIQFTEQDILKPTHESVKQVYEPLVQLLVGVTRCAAETIIFLCFTFLLHVCHQICVHVLMTVIDR